MSGTTTVSAQAEPNAGAHAPGDIEIEYADAPEPSPQVTNAEPAPQRRDRQQQTDRHGEAFEGRRAQRRIAGLISQRNAAQDELERLRHQNAELQRLTLQHGQARLTSEERRAQAEIEAAQRELRRAMSEQDDSAANAAQSRLTDVQVELATIRANKQQVEQAARAPQQPAQPAPTPAMRAWMDENPWFGTEAAMKGAAVGFHHEAVALGHGVESPAYFQHINKRIRSIYPDYQFDDEGDPASDTDADPAPARQRPAPAASGAAPRRNAQPSTAASPARRVIRLSAEQREAARIAGVTEQAYAAQLERINKAGSR